MQAEQYVDPDAFERWDGELNLAPGERWFPKSRVDPGMLRMFEGGR